MLHQIIVQGAPSLVWQTYALSLFYQLVIEHPSLTARVLERPSLVALLSHEPRCLQVPQQVSLFLILEPASTHPFLNRSILIFSVALPYYSVLILFVLILLLTPCLLFTAQRFCQQLAQLPTWSFPHSLTENLSHSDHLIALEEQPPLI